MIYELFSLLFVVSLICLIVGLVKPAFFSKFIKGEITKKKLALIFGSATVVLFVLVSVTMPTQLQQPDNSQKQSAEQTVNQVKPVNNVPKIDYQIIQRWQIPNGGEGKVILIPKEYVNDADMTALGEKLKKDTAGDRNAVIEVFSDRQAAVVRDKVFNSTATKEETDLYDKNYVGSYTRNINTGYHKFEIFFDGVMGTNNKTITY